MTVETKHGMHPGMESLSDMTCPPCPPLLQAPLCPTHAMLLAAGLGARMRPLTLTTPKPLVFVNGRRLLDRALDALEKAQVKTVVVNVHHLAQQICRHIDSERGKRPFELIISDERAALLDSAGGVIKALPNLGEKPFFILNSDTFWHDGGASNLLRLASHFQPGAMDMLLLTVSRRQAGGRHGDFLADGHGHLARARAGDADGVVYAGALLVNPGVFAGAVPAPQSLNLYFDRAAARGRLYGLPLEGAWYTVGSVDSIRAVEKQLRQKGDG